MSETQTSTLSAYDGECECRPCAKCDGEGEFSRYVPGGYFTTRGLQREYQRVETCLACHGTGKDSDDCAVHDRREDPAPLGAFDPRWGITAAQLGLNETGIDDSGEACDACNAGYHDELLIGPKKCACACHAERSAA